MERENKEHILDKIKKASDSENYETTWDEKGIPHSKSKSEIKKGKKSRASGAKFELDVRTDLERQGWIVDKWNNNVDLEKGKIMIAKRKFNPFLKFMAIGTGFPDFVAIKNIGEGIYHVEGIEVKTNGTLSKEEKEKCRWYLKHKVFSKIWVAKKSKERGKIEYIDFAEKYNNL